MRSRQSIDARLDSLARMLVPWLDSNPHPAGFWPQFNQLAAEIIAEADSSQRAYVEARIAAMLAERALL